MKQEFEVTGEVINSDSNFFPEHMIMTYLHNLIDYESANYIMSKYCICRDCNLQYVIVTVIV